MSSMATIEKQKPPEIVFQAPSVGTIIPMKAYSPLEHFDYSLTDSACCCQVCVDWRVKLIALKDAHTHIESHKRDCSCADCSAYMKSRSAYLAALNRRDLYSECSWHALDMEEGARFMGWLTGILFDRKLKSDGWWESRGPHLPLSYWKMMFKRSFAIGASGLV